MENSLSWLYKTSHSNLDSIVTTIDSVLSKSGFEMKVLIIFSEYDIFDLLSTTNIKNLKGHKKELGKEIYYFVLTKTIRGSAKERKCQFIIASLPQESLYLLITHESNMILRRDIIQFLNKFYPKVATLYIDSYNMNSFLVNLEKKISNQEIRITKISKKSRIEKKTPVRRYESNVKWTDMSYKKLFQEIEENDEWIKSLYFTLVDKSQNIEFFKDPYICQISRKGFFNCNQRFSFFYRTIIADMINKASEDLKLLKNRTRTKIEGFKPKPIILKYKYDLFKDKINNKRLIEAIKKIPYSAISVMHSNPYLHCSFVDYQDGSSYDIWVLSNDVITIIPQMRATFASLDRLCNHIFIGFREGKIQSLE